MLRRRESAVGDDDDELGHRGTCPLRHVFDPPGLDRLCRLSSDTASVAEIDGRHPLDICRRTVGGLAFDAVAQTYQPPDPSRPVAGGVASEGSGELRERESTREGSSEPLA